MEKSERYIIPDVSFEMNWGSDPKLYKGKVGTETIYNDELMLAQLLLDRKCHLNNGVFAPGTEWEEKTVCAFVICSDIFCWGSADSEPVLLDQLQDVYLMHMADPKWGVDKWCILQRKEMPQSPVLAAMKKDGVWFSEDSELEENYSEVGWKKNPKNKELVERLKLEGKLS